MSTQDSRLQYLEWLFQNDHRFSAIVSHLSALMEGSHITFHEICDAAIIADLRVRDRRYQKQMNEVIIGLGERPGHPDHVFIPHREGKPPCNP